MKIAIACDHVGYLLKSAVIEVVESAGHEVLDFGTDSPVSVDFPDFAEKAGRALQNGKADRAVLICGSGIGVSITANKLKGVYASVCHDTYSAHQGVEHDRMNALCMGSRIIGEELAKEIVRTFLAAEVLEMEKYQRRVDKIIKIENE